MLNDGADGQGGMSRGQAEGSFDLSWTGRKGSKMGMILWQTSYMFARRCLRYTLDPNGATSSMKL